MWLKQIVALHGKPSLGNCRERSQSCQNHQPTLRRWPWHRRPMTRRFPPLALYGPDWLPAVQAYDEVIERTTMEVLRLEREFLYNGVKLPDTTPTMTPEQVRETYTHLYPEMATAAIEGPETVASKLVYKFVRAIGAKG